MDWHHREELRSNYVREQSSKSLISGEKNSIHKGIPWKSGPYQKTNGQCDDAEETVPDNNNFEQHSTYM